jgi:hypothetical protein
MNKNIMKSVKWFVTYCLIGIASMSHGNEGFYAPTPLNLPTFAVSNSPESCGDCGCNSEWTTIISESYTFGKFAGFNKNYAELDLFIAPPSIKGWQSFADLQGYRIGRHRWGVSIGGGLRWWDACHQSAWGANLYYDYREAAINDFQRLSVGLEYLSKRFDIRFNGYIPITGTVNKGSLHTFTFPGGYIETCRRKQHGFFGFDGEVGIPLGCFKCVSIYNAAGGYYYRTGKNRDQFYGGYYRLGATAWKYLSVEGRFSYDSRYHAQGQGVVALSVPLNDLWNWECSQSCRCPLLIQPVYRNPMITTQNCCEYTQNW